MSSPSKSGPKRIGEREARELVWRVAAEVRDPQTGLSAAELGFLREVNLVGGKIDIAVLPTHRDCPSMNLLTMNLECAIEDAFSLPHVRTLFSPDWTPALMTDQGRAKLGKAFARHGKGWRCGGCGRAFAEFMALP
jgi:ring-1,2-phenylacetyl-CoA epoxidase subunit PaaD